MSVEVVGPVEAWPRDTHVLSDWLVEWDSGQHAMMSRSPAYSTCTSTLLLDSHVCK
jgi:hypothetical protein